MKLAERFFLYWGLISVAVFLLSWGPECARWRDVTNDDSSMTIPFRGATAKTWIIRISAASAFLLLSNGVILWKHRKAVATPASPPPTTPAGKADLP